MYTKKIYKHHDLCNTITDKEKVTSDFMEDLTYCRPTNIVKYKTRVRVAFCGDKYSSVYTLPVKYAYLIEKGEELRKARQYIADLYHCSDCWGQKMTEDEMHTNLEEWQRETDSDEYCPVPDLYMECAAYWNELCDMYPN